MLKGLVGFKRLLLLLLLVILSKAGKGAEWQWSVLAHNVVSQETSDHPRAFLWIPPDCKRVRAVVVGQHNMLEEGILEHLVFRKKLAELNIAEIWITPGLDQVWSPQSNAQNNLELIFDSLASVSGYSELKYAPIIPIGHSAMATFPWNFAAQNNERTLAILSIHGDAPSTNLTGYGRPNLDWNNLSVDGIPGLMVVGEYEWWEARVQPGLNYKKMHPKSCISFFCDAGRGHFDFSEQLVEYLALFIEKAAKYRLPEKYPMNKAVRLIPVDPTKGWLIDRWHKDSIPTAKAAQYNDYKGNKDNAFWYFDKQIARKTETIYSCQRGKAKQYIGYTINGKLISFQPKHFYGYVPKFEPNTDGVTFHLSTVFTDSSHTKIVESHSKSKTEISRICGPVEIVNDSTFRVSFYRMGLNNKKRTADICLIASNKGDETYKSAVQQLLLHIPFSNKEGKEQQIVFDSILNTITTNKFVNLHAVTNTGMPVYYYVQEGPAEVIGNKLILTPIPPKSKFPIKITVLAWQYGRNTEPKIQTAKPVERIFYINNKMR